MKYEEIIQKLPYTKPFLFVDDIIDVDEDGIKGTYVFDAEADFYKGHFKHNPVTPGVILTECCAQIGVVALGIYLLSEDEITLGDHIQIGLSSSEMEFYEPVFPNEKVVVTAEKIYFRFHKLKCKVKMHNSAGVLVCKGTISGMLKSNKNG
ncbi:MAG: hydroxymyristoyl-ACP dehydratase [Maribacter sp.]|uniref:3-hydroxyacyl-ACP dehydratase FabZ family protein n=1 Tax=Maribacter sp. TaxID=1897614 RepID=UPI0032991EDF